MSFDDRALELHAEKVEVSKEVENKGRKVARAILRDLKKYNPKQHAMALDQSPYIAGICPRRAGKSYGGAAMALITGEAVPGSISLIISLNKQQLRRIYWSGGPSGLYMFARKYGIKLEFNSTYLRWEHENGSIGYLLGCEDDEQMEVIRGLEADLYLIDECKSFAPAKLEKLLTEIIGPQRSSRNGRIVMIGTPGFIPAGPFYQATCPRSVDGEGKPYAVPAGQKDPWGRTPEENLIWSLHAWTLAENTAKPQQWIDGLRVKANKKWADDHPIWLREYLGQWTVGGDGLVFSYANEKASGRCTWNPAQTLDNPTGLPADGAPWRLVGGLDLGYEAPTAFVVGAYSQLYRQMRVIYDFSGRHMLTHEIAMMIEQVQKRFGRIEMIYADVGNLGKMVVQELMDDFALPIERAEKREKLDFIERLNGAFALGELLIIPGTTLETQLLTNAWDLDDELEPPKGANGQPLMSARENLARLGKLKEDDSIPNDSTDALLYMFRGSLHRFGKTKKEALLDPNSLEYAKNREKKELAAFRAQLATEAEARNRLGRSQFINPPRGIQRALEKRETWTRSTRKQSTAS